MDHSHNAGPVPSELLPHESAARESVLPIANGKIAVWLFLSTELMFFAALFASYIVLRFGAAAGSWPSQKEVHLSVSIGTTNTIVLLVSSYCIWAAHHASTNDRSGPAKSWVLVTILLGIAFLAVKGYEYKTKFDHGIYPRTSRSLIHETADLSYLSSVSDELKVQLDNPQIRHGDLEVLEQVQSGLVNWTRQKVGSANDPVMQRMALAALAYQISSAEENAKCAKYLNDEKQNLILQKSQLSTAFSASENKLRDVQQSLVSGSDPVAPATAKELTKQVTSQKLMLNQIENRLAALEEFPVGTNGLNRTHGLRLPFVLPSGNTWCNTYYLLTGCHALHIVGGLVALLIIVPLRLNKSRSGLVGNLALYWHFVDAVWICLFVLLYLS